MIRCSQTALSGILAAAAMGWQPSVLGGQGNPYADALLRRIRAAAQSIPGPRPRELRYVSLGEARRPLNLSVAIGDTQRVTSVLPVFQIRFADRWIMVDAGSDSIGMVENIGRMASVGFPQVRYDSVQLALRDADAVVLTHEHFDHAIGVQRGPYFKQVASKTLVTYAQVQSWLHPPAQGFMRMTADSVSGFRPMDYDLVHAIAPGVVLIKAPGHTPGSQFIYVRLADDREILLIGDLVWMMPGLVLNLQKPQSEMDKLKEDRAAIQQQMNWVRSILDGKAIAVAPSHDKSQLDALVTQGVLHVGLDLRRN